MRMVWWEASAAGRALAARGGLALAECPVYEGAVGYGRAVATTGAGPGAACG